MNDMPDFLIIGQGLAGSLLARELIRRGRRVRVLDDGHRTASSRVAAGLINPLAGMRFNAAPETGVWLEQLRRSYGGIADALHTRPYLHEVPMQRLLRSPEQRRFLERQQRNPAAAAYLGRPFGPGQADPGIRAPHGGFEQHATGFVDLPRLLDDLRDWLQGQAAYARQTIDHAAIGIQETHIRLGGHQARQIVFCEGYRMLDNPWFGDLPLQPDQGEMLRLASQRPLCHHIINGAHWLVPLGDGHYRFGATHEHQRIDGRPSTQGREQLLQGLRQLLQDHSGIEIEAHAAGVRPATRDRQPLVGTHPRLRRLHLFNGFGARGALSIPWYATRMADYLLDGRPLPEKADIARLSE